jgi:hypothetical protein
VYGYDDYDEDRRDEITVVPDREKVVYSVQKDLAALVAKEIETARV